MRKICTVLFFLSSFVIGAVFAQPKIIIKLDDLGSKDNRTTAEAVLNTLLERHIKTAIGVIANRLDSTAGQAYSKYLEATNDKGEKLFEIWNHGLDHSKNNPPGHSREFKGTSYGFQKEHLEKAHKRVQKLLGVDMHTFGAPFNANDSVTYRVLEQEGGYHIVLFGSMEADPSGRLRNLNNRVDMEISTGQVNYQYFVSQYKKHKQQYQDYMVLQGHAVLWDADKLVEFNKILDYLLAEKAEFILPDELFAASKNSSN